MPASVIELQKLAGFPARCVNLRSKLGLPQSELARWLGVSTPCISLLEHGRRTPSAAVFQLFEKLESGSLHHRLSMHSPKPESPAPSLNPGLPPHALAALDQFRPASPHSPLPSSSVSTPAKPSDLASRVKKLRDHLGVTRPKLAVMMGVCRQYITKVENGGRASKPFVKLIERLENELLHPKPAAPLAQPAARAAPPAASSSDPSRITLIPLLSQRDALLLASPGSASRFAREHIPFNVSDSAAFAVRLAGDAMHPLHIEGEIAICYPGALPRIGDRVIVRVHDDIGGEVLFRILTASGDLLTLSSPNPVYSPLYLPRSSLHWICPVAATIRHLLS